VPKGLFYRVSSMELGLFIIFIIPAILGSYILLVMGSNELIPPLLLGLLLVQLVMEILLIYRFLVPRLGIGYSSGATGPSRPWLCPILPCKPLHTMGA